jgi:integrase
MPRRLTEAMVTALAATDRDQFLFDSTVPGPAVRITPAGTKIFFAQLRIDGRKPRVTVGYHPILTVSATRELARQALADLREGRNPALERRSRRQAIAARGTTIAALADRWLAEHVFKLKPRTRFDYEDILRRHILPALGRLTVAGITRDDIDSLHIRMRKTPRRANYTITVVHALMEFARVLGLRSDNPARGIKRYREKQHERFLSEAEIRRAVETIVAAKARGSIGPYAAAGLLLCLYTGARSGEIAAAKWEHVNLDRRIIRLPDSKSGEPRTIHLSEPAVEILKSLRQTGPYVLAGRQPRDPFKSLSRTWIAIRADAGLSDVRLHDIRHSYASLLAARGVPLQAIGKLLGHRRVSTTARYAHLADAAVAAINDDLGAAMQAAIEKKAQPVADVLKLRRRRGRR